MIRLPETVQYLLDGAIARIRRIYLLRGVAATLAALLSATLAVMAVDAKFTLYSDAARWGLSSIVYFAVALSAYLTLVRPLSRRIDRLRVAKILDARHPAHEEALTTLVELVEEAGEKGHLACSRALFGLLSRKAESAACAIAAEREFTARTVVRRLRWLGGAAALLAVAIAFSPQVAGKLLVRAVAPWVDIGNLYAGDIAVTPGDAVVLSGTVVRIEAKVNPALMSEPSIRISRRSKIGWSEETLSAMPDGVYEATADLAENEWRYRVCAGPAVTRYYTIRVCEMPRAEAFSVEVKYPEYTGWSPAVYSGDEVSSLSALEGSRLSFSLRTAPGTRGTLLVGGRETFEHSMVSNRVANWTLSLENADGFKAPERGGRLQSLLDISPTVLIETPAAKRLRLPPHAKIPLLALASDDVGIAKAALRMATNGAAACEIRPLSAGAKPGASLWKFVDEIDLSDFDLNAVREVSFDVVVEDNYPAALSGPHSATSQPVVVELDCGAKNFAQQSLAATADAAGKLLAEARKRVSDAAQKAREARERLQREHKADRELDDKIARAVHEAVESGKRLDETAGLMEEDARFRPLADAVRQMREEPLERALKQLEKAQFAATEERRQALEKSEEELRRVESALRKFEEPLKERLRRLEQLEAAKDLESRQAALAKAAEEILRERPVDTRKLEVWKRMEQEASSKAEELRRRTDDPGFAEARRKMKRAAALMDEFKKELENAADATKDDAARERHAAELKRAALARSDEALKTAAEAARATQNQLDEARHERHRTAELARAAEHWHNRSADQLENADADEKLHKLARDAEEAIRAVQSNDHAPDDARDAAAKYRRALDAARKAANEARVDRELAGKPSETAAAEAAKRRAEESARARSEAAEAQRQAAAALENPTSEEVRKAAAAAERAAEAMTKAMMPEELREAQENALAAANELVRQIAQDEIAARYADEAEKLAQAAKAAAAAAESAAQAAAERQQAAIKAQSAAAESTDPAVQQAAAAVQAQAEKEMLQAAESERKAAAARRAAEAARGAAAMAADDDAATENAHGEALRSAAADKAVECDFERRQAAQRQAAQAQREAAELLAEAQQARAKGDRETDEIATEEARAAQTRALEAQREALSQNLPSPALSEAPPPSPADASGSSYPAAADRQAMRRELAHATSATEQALAEAMADDRKTEAAQAAADRLAQAAQALRQRREETLNAAGRFMVDAALRQAKQLEERAAKEIARRNFAAAAASERMASEAKANALSAMEAMRSAAKLDAEGVNALGRAIAAEREAQRRQHESMEHAERASRQQHTQAAEQELHSRQAEAAEWQQRVQDHYDRAVESAARTEPPREATAPDSRHDPAGKAADAAAELARRVERQMRDLAIDPNSAASASGVGENDRSGGGLSAQIKALAEQLKRDGSPEDLSALFEKTGWFRIKGAAKNGLGERDLDAVPAEYRELVRQYFLKLAEE